MVPGSIVESHWTEWPLAMFERLRVALGYGPDPQVTGASSILRLSGPEAEHLDWVLFVASCEQ